MRTIHRSRRLFIGIAALHSVVLFTPVAALAQEQDIAAAPASPSWDETSGYGSVEASRAAISGSSWSDTSGPSSTEASRVIAAERALLSDDLGSLQEEALAAVVAAAPSWDETSGYGSVEATRAAISAPPAAPSVEASRVAAAQAALQSDDLGSMQEEALMAVVAAGAARDETSGYDSVEATCAAISEDGSSAAMDEAERLAQFRAVEFEMSRYLQLEP